MYQLFEQQLDHLRLISVLHSERIFWHSSLLKIDRVCQRKINLQLQGLKGNITGTQTKCLMNKPLSMATGTNASFSGSKNLALFKPILYNPLKFPFVSHKSNAYVSVTRKSKFYVSFMIGVVLCAFN